MCKAGLRMTLSIEICGLVKKPSDQHDSQLLFLTEGFYTNIHQCKNEQNKSQ
jgi:hypothetical protein